MIQLHILAANDRKAGDGQLELRCGPEATVQPVYFHESG